MKTTIRATAAMLAALPMIAMANTAAGYELYVIGASATVYAIDPDAHTVTPRATVSFGDDPWPVDVAGSAIAATCDGTIYLTRLAYHTLTSTIGGAPPNSIVAAFGEGRDGFLYVGDRSDLYRVNPADGSQTFLGSGPFNYAGDLASDPLTGDLYGITGTQPLNTYDQSLRGGLVRVSKVDGSQTTVGAPYYGYGLAFTADGRLWAIPCNIGPPGNNLCEVDKNTGTATFAMDLSAIFPAGSTYDLASQASCDDGNPCTDDICTPLGLCQHANNTATCEDGNSCTGASLCSGGVCSAGSILPDGSACTGDDICRQATAATCLAGVCNAPALSAGTPCTDDGMSCTVDECDGSGTCAHDETPRTCRTAAKGKLSITNSSDDSRDKFSLKMSSAPASSVADLADPTARDVYAACVYSNGSLAFQTRVAASGICAGKPCWVQTKTGFKFKNKSGATTGITTVTLKGSAKATTKLAMKGQGTSLAEATLPFSQPIVAQIVNADTGQCFEADFLRDDRIKKNSTEGFVANAGTP